MPTARKRRARTWQDQLECHRIEYLMNGPGRVSAAMPNKGYPEGAIDEMRVDLGYPSRSGCMRWWVFDENEPSMKPWTFVPTPNPGERPWAWWQFDAPEPLPEGETERHYLERHGLIDARRS